MKKTTAVMVMLLAALAGGAALIAGGGSTPVADVTASVPADTLVAAQDKKPIIGVEKTKDNPLGLNIDLKKLVKGKAGQRPAGINEIWLSKNPGSAGWTGTGLFDLKHDIFFYSAKGNVPAPGTVSTLQHDAKITWYGSNVFPPYQIFTETDAKRWWWFSEGSATHEVLYGPELSYPTNQFCKCTKYAE